MSFLEFLDRLKNTLEGIEVKGQQNINTLCACFSAIDEMKNSIVSSIQQEALKEKQDGGEEDGRQTDIGFNDSDTDKG